MIKKKRVLKIVALLVTRSSYAERKSTKEKSLYNGSTRTGKKLILALTLRQRNRLVKNPQVVLRQAQYNLQQTKSTLMEYQHQEIRWT